MASAQVHIEIRNGDDIVPGGARRPVRLTPDGYAGVVFAGAVYPLYSGNHIDISGPSWEIEDCNRFVIAGTQISYAPDPDGSGEPVAAHFTGPWHVETNKFGHYLVFNATEPVATRVVDALESAGLAVQRWDVSHRAADDGNFYDWFARLRFQGDHDECRKRIAGALADLSRQDTSTVAKPGGGAATTPVTEGTRGSESTAGAAALSQSQTLREDLAARVEQLLAEVAEVSNQLQAAHREAKILQDDLASAQATQARQSAELDQSAAHQRSLRDEIRALQASTEINEATQEILTKWQESEEILEFALAENSELHHQIDEGSKQRHVDVVAIDNLTVQLTELQGAIAEVHDREKERRLLRSPRRGPRAGVEGFLMRTYPRIEFVLDSLDVIAEFDAPGALIRTLGDIDRGLRVGQDLESVRGWSEVTKVATGIAGREDMGRIYYRPLDGRVTVCVHVKHDEKDQKRLLDRLRDL